MILAILAALLLRDLIRGTIISLYEGSTDVRGKFWKRFIARW